MARQSTQRNERQQRLAQIKKEQQARERRTVVTIVAACTAIVLVIVGFIGYGVYDGIRNQPATQILSVGVPASSASCDAPTTDPAAGSGEHVGPGTNSPAETKVQYSTVPPSTGKHFAQPALDGRGFYTKADTPAVETLVHNLEHGYTVLWYLDSEEQAKGAQLRQLAELGNKLDGSKGKFIVAAWNPAYGDFPAGKKFALSHWSGAPGPDGKGTQVGHRQLCGDLSGEVVKAFVTSYPSSDSPEPQGA